MKIVSFFFFFPVMLLCAQQPLLIKEIKLSKANIISADPIGNVYVADQHQLTMINRGDSIFKTFSNLRLGRLTSLDASNPMKVLLYFKDQGSIIYLDNTISELNPPIYLSQYGLDQSTLACASFDNGFWVYMPSNFELIRFNNQLEIVNRTKNIKEWIGVEQWNPIEMKESSNLLYVNDPETGIAVFDIFGGYVKSIPIFGIEKFEIWNDQLIYRKNDQIYLFNNITFTEQAFTFPDLSNPKDFDISYHRLYMLVTDKLLIYQLNP